MKLLWHSLIVVLGILQPISTLTVLAQSRNISGVKLTPQSSKVLVQEVETERSGDVVKEELTESFLSNILARKDEEEKGDEGDEGGEGGEGDEGDKFTDVKATEFEERLLTQPPITVVIPNSNEKSNLTSEPTSETPTTIVIPDTSASPLPPETNKTENGKTPTIPNAPDSETQPNQNGETPPETNSETSTDTQPQLTPEELARQEKLIEADRLYKSGDIAAAQKLYREAKAPFVQSTENQTQPSAIYDPSQLSPAGAVYWRQAQSGLQQNLETKILIPLKFLVQQQPEFIPAQVQYAQALKNYGQEEESLQVLERATTLYPNEPDLIKTKITALNDVEKWLEASLAARQFALLNPTHPQAAEFETMADEYLARYQSHLRSEMRGNAIANVITGALGYIFTGNIFGPISAIDSTVLLLRGESAVGEKLSERVQKQLPMLEDEEVLEYVRELGNKLAAVAGRKEFEYQFYVVMDDQINAFALPGGKIFVNAGAILKTKSEAELAGLLGHELSHAVLSHGFQLVTEGNLIANITQYIPFGGTAANLIVLNYSRDMERQADDLGTKILVGGGYAADGLHNLMITLSEEEKERPVFAWLSTHPDTKERIDNLEALIDRNGYNRYAYEGVERHLAIQKRVRQLLQEYKDSEEKEKEEEEEE